MVKNNPLDDIVKCTISISNPAKGTETYGSIISIVPNVATATTPGMVLEVTALSDLTEYGYADTDAVYVALSKVFAQAKKPDHIYIYGRVHTEATAGDNPQAEGWYEKNGSEYVLSSDTTVDVEKTYYEASYLYSEVEPQSGDNPQSEGWYEKVGDDYVLSSDTEVDAGKTYYERSVAYTAVEAHPATPEVNQSAIDALKDADKQADFHGVYVIAPTADDLSAVATWVEANEKLFAYEFTTDENPLTDYANFARTMAMYSGSAEGGVTPEYNSYVALSWLAYNYAMTPGTETWANEPIAGFTPSAISAATKKSFKDACVNLLLRYANKVITIGGKVGADEWIDTIRFRDYLKNEIQMAAFNVFYVNDKVGFTDPGIAKIESAVNSVLLANQSTETVERGIAPDSYDSDGNLVPGYTLTVPNASDFTEAQRATRVLTGIEWSARLTGAIHCAEINGVLTN